MRSRFRRVASALRPLARAGTARGRSGGAVTQRHARRRERRGQRSSRQRGVLLRRKLRGGRRRVASAAKTSACPATGTARRRMRTSSLGCHRYSLGDHACGGSGATATWGCGASVEAPPPTARRRRSRSAGAAPSSPEPAPASSAAPAAASRAAAVPRLLLRRIDSKLRRPGRQWDGRPGRNALRTARPAPSGVNAGPQHLKDRTKAVFFRSCLACPCRSATEGAHLGRS